MLRFIILFILFLKTLVLAQTEEVITSLAECTKTDFEFSGWISGINHKLTAKGVHIFAIEITNVFSPNPDRKEFWIEFSMGPIPIHTEGSFDGTRNYLEICNYAYLPIIGKVKLGCGYAVNGRISICFDVRLVKGKHDYIIRDNWLYVEYNDIAVGIPHNESVRLIPLPVKGGGAEGEGESREPVEGEGESRESVEGEGTEGGEEGGEETPG